MMTEEEAKTKWCPHARVIHEIFNNGENLYKQMAANKFGDGLFSQACCCIASACMAWRTRVDNGYALTKSGQWVAGAEPASILGYCGLAGAP